MVNLGPQLVQLMNGYAKRLSAGSASSARHSSQVALSAETSARRRPVWSLATIENPRARLGAMAAAVTRSTRASGGGCASSRPRNSLTPAAEPSTSANTPSTSLPTHPASPSRVASEYTKGRKPTPCTTPSTRMDARTMLITRPVSRFRRQPARDRPRTAAAGVRGWAAGSLCVIGSYGCGLPFMRDFAARAVMPPLAPVDPASHDERGGRNRHEDPALAGGGSGGRVRAVRGRLWRRRFRARRDGLRRAAAGPGRAGQAGGIRGEEGGERSHLGRAEAGRGRHLHGHDHDAFR